MNHSVMEILGGLHALLGMSRDSQIQIQKSFIVTLIIQLQTVNLQ